MSIHTKHVTINEHLMAVIQYVLYPATGQHEDGRSNGEQITEEIHGEKHYWYTSKVTRVQILGRQKDGSFAEIIFPDYSLDKLWATYMSVLKEVVKLKTDFA